MASSGGPFYTAGQVCEMVTDDDGGDLMEYILPGSDDNFDAGDLQEEYDRVSREQSGQDFEAGQEAELEVLASKDLGRGNRTVSGQVSLLRSSWRTSRSLWDQQSHSETTPW